MRTLRSPCGSKYVSAILLIVLLELSIVTLSLQIDDKKSGQAVLNSADRDPYQFSESYVDPVLTPKKHTEAEGAGLLEASAQTGQAPSVGIREYNFQTAKPEYSASPRGTTWQLGKVPHDGVLVSNGEGQSLNLGTTNFGDKAWSICTWTKASKSETWPRFFDFYTRSGRTLEDRAFSFSGSYNAYVQTVQSPSLDLINTVTMSFWMKVFFPQGDDLLFDMNGQDWANIVWRGKGSRTYTMWLNRWGYLHLSQHEVGTGTNCWINSNTYGIKPYIWYHVTATINRPNGYMDIWVDNQRQGFANIASRTAIPSGSEPLIIGNIKGGGDLREGWWPAGFQGQLREFSIWNRALTDAERTNLFNKQPLTGLESGLVVAYRMNFLQNGWTADTSINRLDGQLGAEVGVDILSSQAMGPESAYYFNGAGNQYLTTPDRWEVDPTRFHTISFWIRPDYTARADGSYSDMPAGSASVLYKGLQAYSWSYCAGSWWDGWWWWWHWHCSWWRTEWAPYWAHHNYAVYLNNEGSITYASGDGGSWSFIKTWRGSVPARQWTQVSVRLNRADFWSGLQIYLNGRRARNGACTWSGWSYDTGEPLLVAKPQDYSGRAYYRGWLAELQFWSVSRDPNALFRDHNKIVTLVDGAKPGGLVAYWRLNSNHGCFTSGVCQTDQASRINLYGYGSVTAKGWSPLLVVDTTVVNDEASVSQSGPAADAGIFALNNIVLSRSGRDAVYTLYQDTVKTVMRAQAKWENDKWIHLCFLQDAGGMARIVQDDLPPLMQQMPFPKRTTRDYGLIAFSYPGTTASPASWEVDSVTIWFDSAISYLDAQDRWADKQPLIPEEPPAILGSGPPPRDDLKLDFSFVADDEMDVYWGRSKIITFEPSKTGEQRYRIKRAITAGVPFGQSMTISIKNMAGESLAGIMGQLTFNNLQIYTTGARGWKCFEWPASGGDKQAAIDYIRAHFRDGSFKMDDTTAGQNLIWQDAVSQGRHRLSPWNYKVNYVAFRQRKFSSYAAWIYARDTTQGGRNDVFSGLCRYEIPDDWIAYSGNGPTTVYVDGVPYTPNQPDAGYFATRRDDWDYNNPYWIIPSSVTPGSVLAVKATYAGTNTGTAGFILALSVAGKMYKTHGGAGKTSPSVKGVSATDPVDDGILDWNDVWNCYKPADPASWEQSNLFWFSKGFNDKDFKPALGKGANGELSNAFRTATGQPVAGLPGNAEWIYTADDKANSGFNTVVYCRYPLPDFTVADGNSGVLMKRN